MLEGYLEKRNVTAGKSSTTPHTNGDNEQCTV
jgi:hypothetical protein